MKLNISSFAEKNVIVVGDLMIDVYYNCTMDRISPEAPIPILRTDHSHIFKTLGGAANTANNFAQLGASTTLIGIGSKDYLEDLCRQNGIELILFGSPLVKTIQKVRFKVGHYQAARVDFEKCKMPYIEYTKASDQMGNTVEKLIKTKKIDILVLSDYGKGTLPVQLCEKLIRLAAKNDIPIYVDPKGTNWAKYEYATCITPNFSEFSAMTSRNEEYNNALINEQAISLMADFAFESMLITRGKEGMSYIDHNQYIHQQSKAKEVFDVSGAGDTVIAVFSLARESGFDVRTSIDLANEAAKIVIGKSGTCPIKYDELLRSINNGD